MKARKSLTRFTSFLTLILAVCLIFSAAAEDELSIADLNPEDVEEVSMEAPLISNPLPIDFTGGFPLQEQFYLDAQTSRPGSLTSKSAMLHSCAPPPPSPSRRQPPGTLT